MNKNLVRIALLGALAVSSAYATEMRTPWISNSGPMGPLRYTFEKFNKDKSNLNIWGAAHMKEAHKAFLKHGTETKDLAALIFNKPSFTIDEALPDETMPTSAQYYNPLVGRKTITPSVQYMEYGLTLGGRWDYPVWNNKGRIGIRGSVPFRRIEMERQDSGLVEGEDPTREFVRGKLISISTKADGAVGAAADIFAKAYRMDLIMNMIYADGNTIFVLPGGAGRGATILGTVIGSEAGAANGNQPMRASTNPGPIAALTIPDSNSPTNPLVYAWQTVTAGTPVLDVASSNFPLANVVSMEPGFAANMPDDQHLGYFNTEGTTVYAANTRDALLAKSKNLWLVFRRATDSSDVDKFNDNVAGHGGGEGIARTIDNQLSQWNQNAFSYLAQNGYFMEDQVRTGMGDIDLDFFYEHTFNKEWNGELCVGVRFPTGGDQDKYGNPYKVMLGNGEHWEIKLGGLLAYQPLTWMNVKADASWNFVLEGVEHRMAVYKGSTIKNFGSYIDGQGHKADADVDWGYFKGHVDFTFFHPKTSDVRSTIGYELYYKTEDRLTYKIGKMEPWYGGTIDATTGVTHPLADLDSNAARKNTEAIAHKVRFESSYQLTKWVEMFAGGSMAVAGQNAMRDRDGHCGFNVRF